MKKTKEDILTFEDIKRLSELVFIPSGYVVQLKDLENNLLWEDSNTVNSRGDHTGQKCYNVNFGRNTPCPHCTAEISINEMTPQVKEDRNVINGRWYRVIAFPILYENDLAAIELIQDITGEKIQGQTLDSILSKDSLMTNIIRHDIPNYLNIINVALEGLSVEILSEKDSKKFLEIARSNAQRTLTVLSELRQLSKIGDPLADLRRINILSVLERTLDEVKSLHPTREINSTLLKDIKQEEAEIWGNTLISEIFQNIFTNSIKYTSSNEVILLITVKKAVDDQEHIEIIISDQGQGIPPEIKDVIFDRAERMKEGWKPSSESTGLGSTIIKSLVDVFGGKVEYKNRVENDWTKGTSVSIRFPQAQAENED